MYSIFFPQMVLYCLVIKKPCVEKPFESEQKHEFGLLQYIIIILIYEHNIKGVMSWPKLSTCFQILKPTMNKWAQYPAQMEV